MKSILFSRLDLSDERNKGFSTDLVELLQLSQSQLDALVKSLPEYLESTTKPKKSALISDIAQSTGILQYRLDSLIAILIFFLAQMEDDEISVDEPDAWMQDLQELGVLSDENSVTFLRLIQELKTSTIERFSRIRRIQLETGGVLPSFSSIGYTVEMRGVFSEDYESWKPLETYSPKLLDLVPVASISIGIRGEAKSEVAFQASLDQIDIMLGHLNAAKKLLLQMKSGIELH